MSSRITVYRNEILVRKSALRAAWGGTYEASGDVEEFLGLGDGFSAALDLAKLFDAVFEDPDFLLGAKAGLAI